MRIGLLFFYFSLVLIPFAPLVGRELAKVSPEVSSLGPKFDLPKGDPTIPDYFRKALKDAFR